MTDLVARVRRGFADAYGGAPDLIARAPGRVNLIGEHTDYNDGFVLPAAISGQTLVAAKRIAARRIEVVATDFQGERDSFLLDKEMAHSPDPHWADYVRGMVIAMERAGLRISGAQLAVAGDVPRGAGLSSSASITVAMGVALGRLSKLTIDPTDLARMAQAAETDFVGTRVGIMDQLISARGVAGHALLIDCRSLDCRPVPIPPDAAILIVHSGIERGLVDGAYNARRAQCEAAARALGIAALRDADMKMLEAGRALMDDITFRRARHVITENARTLSAAGALQRCDLATLGQLMAASHTSMRDDFEITLPPIDQLVALLQNAIGDGGGARMTGGGFGGAVVAVLSKGRLEAAQAAVHARYRTPDGALPLMLVETASDGASLLT